jgi:hypothetical protein
MAVHTNWEHNFRRRRSHHGGTARGAVRKKMA